MAATQYGQRILRRYRVEQLLGEGGMGVVHAALDEQTGRRLAIKRLTPEAATRRRVVSLFEREFHTLKSLAHPNIVGAIDYGVGDVPFYTMELLSGEPVAAQAPMPWQRACAVLRDVAVALSLVHSRRLIHRDVTCRNIQICSDGTTKLIDFGGLAPFGVSRDMVGTPPYIAPEVLNQLTLDQRTDLYSLGAAAYFLITGKHAYPARIAALLRDLWRSRLRAPSASTDVPVELDDLVMSLLNLDPGARPPNAGVVVARLTAIAGLPPLVAEVTARSFLTSPRLVGREHAVTVLQGHVRTLGGGRGGLLLLHSAPGMGRSRLLDTFALEAQVIGASVLRLDARDGADEAALRHSLERGLRREEPNSDNAPAIGDDAEPLDAFLKRLRRAARRRGLAVLIDDLERFEPTALALVLRLAHMTESQPLLLVAAHVVPLPEAVQGAVDLLTALGAGIELGPLSASETHELVASCFDGAANLQAAAAFCHALSAGRPETIVTLAQHLVDKGIARLEEGAWHLPPSLEATICRIRRRSF